MQENHFFPSVVSNYIWGLAWDTFSSSVIGHRKDQDFRELFATMPSMALTRMQKVASRPDRMKMYLQTRKILKVLFYVSKTCSQGEPDC